MIEIVSVHFPKAAGSSSGRSLVAAYGQDAVYFDYQDDPVDPCSCFNVDPERCRRRADEIGTRADLRVVHGHFHPAKYDSLDTARRITFLRHPVENVVSIYGFWRTQEKGHALFTYAREERLDLLELARLPAIRYLLSRTYFGGVDMSRFAFIGFSDAYADSLQRLSSVLGVPLPELKVNVNEDPESRRIRESHLSDRKLMLALNDLLAEDIRFYDSLKSKWS